MWPKLKVKLMEGKNLNNIKTNEGGGFRNTNG
jgi:hypothetical protein